MKSKKKIAIVMCILLLGITATLSGCIDTVKTVGWKHGSDDHLAVLKGLASEKYEGFSLARVEFVYDNESGKKLEDYDKKVNYENMTIDKTIGKDKRYFEAEIGVNPFEPCYFRAVAVYARTDGNNEDSVILGEQISFSLSQGASEESAITEEIIKEELLKK